MSDYIDTREGWREVNEQSFVINTGTPSVAIFDGDGNALHRWVREEPVPPLPTEPGYYLTTEPDYGGGPVVVELLNSPKGQWVDAGDREYLNPGQVEDILPLVRLEPRAVTAKAVLERVVERAILVRRDQIDPIRDEFGVQP